MACEWMQKQYYIHVSCINEQFWRRNKHPVWHNYPCITQAAEYFFILLEGSAERNHISFMPSTALVERSKISMKEFQVSNGEAFKLSPFMIPEAVLESSFQSRWRREIRSTSVLSFYIDVVFLKGIEGQLYIFNLWHLFGNFRIIVFINIAFLNSQFIQS